MPYAYFSLNNPGNIGWYRGEGWGAQPSSAQDTGHSIAAYPDLASGYNAMADLALRKYRGGAQSLNQLIAGPGGWTPGNKIAAANIARTIGITPDQDLRLSDPAGMAAFQRALTLQETGSSQQWDEYSGKPHAPLTLAARGASARPPGPVDPSTIAHGAKPGPPIPGATINTTGGPSSPSTGSQTPGGTPGAPGAAPGATKGSQRPPGGSDDDIKPMQLAPLQPGRALGGVMMAGPGSINLMGRQSAQPATAYATTTQPVVPSSYPTGLPPSAVVGGQNLGTTLNSPSALQLALMRGGLNPWDQGQGGFDYGSM